MSDDDRFLVKTVSREEMRSLLRMLPEYVAHVTRPANAAAVAGAAGATGTAGAAAAGKQQQQPSTPPPLSSSSSSPASAPSLLTRFYGVHRVTPSGGAKVRFVVMGNVFPSDVVLHRRYDLKGSRHGRTAGPEALARPNAVLKDLDVDLALALDARTHAELTRALRADAAFLERLGLIDYSLLLGVHFGGWAPGCWRPPGAPAGSEAPLPPVRQQPVAAANAASLQLRGRGEGDKGGEEASVAAAATGGDDDAAAAFAAAAAPVKIGGFVAVSPPLGPAASLALGSGRFFSSLARAPSLPALVAVGDCDLFCSERAARSSVESVNRARSRSRKERREKKKEKEEEKGGRDGDDDDDDAAADLQAVSLEVSPGLDHFWGAEDDPWSREEIGRLARRVVAWVLEQDERQRRAAAAAAARG